MKLPHKFKIAVGGCPNNCVKPDLNDLGIIGQKVPEITLEKCRGCKKCQIVEKLSDSCAPRWRTEKSLLIRKNATTADAVWEMPLPCGRSFLHSGYRIYIGGRWGKHVAQGRYLDKIFTDKQEVLAVVEKAILLFREQGNTGERFSDTIARLGFENVQEQLLSDDLLKRKEENIKAEKHLVGGATC